MKQENDWLTEVFDEVREQVQKWPEWKRSAEVRRELRKLEEHKRATQGDAPVPAMKAQGA